MWAMASARILPRKRVDPDALTSFVRSIWDHVSVEKNGEEIVVDCPWCSRPKLSINPDKNVFQCWRCEESGPVIKLFEELIELGHIKYEDVSAFYRKGKTLKTSISKLNGGKVAKDAVLWDEVNVCVYPEGCYPLDEKGSMFQDNRFTRNMAKAAVKYLKKRGFSFKDRVIQDADLMFMASMGNTYNGHIFFPVFDKIGKDVIYWTTRSILADPDKKSLHAGRYYSKNTSKTVLFNEHKLKPGRVVAITEGPFDCFSVEKYVGIPTVCLLGKQLHDYHTRAIASAKPSMVLVCLDSDATEYSRRMCKTLQANKLEARVVELKEGDPNEIPPRELKRIFNYEMSRESRTSDFWVPPTFQR